jgi:hypothetical protein
MRRGPIQTGNETDPFADFRGHLRFANRSFPHANDVEAPRITANEKFRLLLSHREHRTPSPAHEQPSPKLSSFGQKRAHVPHFGSLLSNFCFSQKKLSSFGQFSIPFPSGRPPRAGPEHGKRSRAEQTERSEIACCRHPEGQHRRVLANRLPKAARRARAAARVNTEHEQPSLPATSSPPSSSGS